MTKTAKFNFSIGILGLLTLLGMGALVYQLVNGLGVTGMNNVVSWGLYITMFMFFVGLSAGGLIVSSSATVFNIPAFKVVAKPATILSTICIVLATAFIVVDLGSPFRMFNLILHSQFKSPLMWDVIVISLYLTINLVYLYLLTRKEPNQKILKITSSIALPVAILVHSVTAWVFSLQIARAGWHSALMAPLFVASALDSGLALLLLVLIALTALNIFHVDKKLIGTLAGLLVTCVAVDAYMVFSEVLTMAYPQEESTMLILNEMLSGSMAPFFWGEVILGFVIPIAILVFRKNRQKTGLIIFSSAMVVIGVFCKRVWLVLTSFRFPNVDGSPGVTIGSFSGNGVSYDTMWTTIGQYAPTFVELSVVIGLLALGSLAFIYLCKKLLMPSKNETSSEQ
ncbi:NrfD/PsrC family molybdoenzyme membrane anchor subunit [Lentibacillus cibarius]|uniref:Oxidoreductase n=1 Tax=Lentibacillus cibarius TaxID=2583219 RepID=A0A5S3QKH2_9BACI|nr:NrfD/PsrC family molybdoenzyme membrane anchor subunit [Lentibacillus cibarius]TMN22227.1 oxidoreductase [Lentibacillus cibarius]